MDDYKVTDKNYIKIDNPYDIDTDFTFNKLPEENISLLIEPICLERPKIVSFTPAYDPDGVYRDRRIRIMFNCELDSETIYYTPEEREEIKSQNTGATINWLEDNGKAYGYKIDDDDNSIVYKCLTITKLYNKNVNLLKHYGVPEFDDGNAFILLLPAKFYKEGDDQLPPASTDILVNVSKNIGVTKVTSAGKTVVAGIYSDDPRSYFTNSKHDSDPPIFDDFSVKNENSISLTTDVSNEKTIVPDKNLQVKKIKVSGSISDTGTGPKSLTAKIKLIDNNYFDTSSYNIKNWTVKLDLEIIGSRGEIKTGESSGCEIDLTDVIKEEKISGVFSVTFIASDKNEQESSSKTYYFIQDTTPPVIPSDIKYSRTGDNTAVFSWTTSDKDFASAIIKTKSIKGGTKTIADLTVARKTSGNSYSVTLNTLEALVKYQHSVIFYDYAGNKSDEYTFSTDNTPPSLPEKIWCERTGPDRVYG